MTKRVLDVGNCAYDHQSIRALLLRDFQAETIAAHSASEALREAETGRYDLILVNRVLDEDGSLGIEIIETLKSQPQTKDLPVMLITNYAEHQATAIAAGAEPGFGKQTLHAPETNARLQAILGK
ncbi:MAG TPA: response regulator [Pirellulaceae bacterium]|nr:response regulator [Pirellulaceae bacterium]